MNTNKKLNTYANKYLQAKMWHYEYTNDICPLLNNKKIEEICTNIDILIENIYKETITDLLLHLTIIKRVYVRILINTYYIATFYLVLLWR